MIKYNCIGFWNGFCNSNNFITNNLLYDSNIFQFVDNYDEIDLLIIGCFINENDYNLIINKSCFKVIYISEPIERFDRYKYIYTLYNSEYNIGYNIITGCINNDIINNRYKYPLYLCYFNYKDSKNIFKNVNDYVKSCEIQDKDFAVLINTHDDRDTRKQIYEKIKDIDHITCPSNLFNNCSNEELNKIGNVEYIRKFKYNLCAENCSTNVKGYITEKLLNCCLSGSIPIYYGSFDEIDEKIFNKNRILFYDPLNEDSLNNIRNILLNFKENEFDLINFYRQNVFCEDAYLVINELEDNLITKLKIN
jgi:hypothetical protein